ncbi:MAG: NADH dehydrogenase FAD-containing subunit [Desulfobacteraceae bacterium]|nr:MAG: NADH dehydrogenase FAD-containing subunit [Desulfobacteraceae bacterium]
MEKRIEALENQMSQLQDTLVKIEKNADEQKLAMIVFSGDLDKALAAFIIATGAVAMGMEVVMFFTFWGTPLLRKKDGDTTGQKDMFGKMFGAMLPKGASKATLSKMNMGGAGTQMMKTLMKKKNVASLDEMIQLAAELEVKIYICEMSMDLMGFSRSEMIDYPDLGYAGVATFLSEAGTSRVQLFI